MTTPRTPEHFPRMKVRGGRRRRDAAIHQASSLDWPAFGRMMATAFDNLAEAVASAGRALQRFTSSMLASLWVARKRERDGWIATHQLPATPSPYAAPIQR